MAQTLSALVSGAVEGLVSDVVILDHGSTDGSSRVADAAGCRFHTNADLKAAIQEARGDWLLLVEAGSRLQNGWIDEVLEYISLNRHAARFSPSRNYRRPLLQRIRRKVPVLEYGLLIPKDVAVASVGADGGLDAIARAQKSSRLKSEIIPAWVSAAAR